jgi:hypothetical protein
MDNNRRYLNQRFGELCGPLAGRAADILGLERDDLVLRDLCLRTFWAGIEVACNELQAQAVEQAAKHNMEHPEAHNINIVFSIDTSLPDGPLAG